jgi:peroxiredoxin
LVISPDGKPLKNLHNPDRIRFYLVPGTIEIKTKDSISRATVIGSKINEDYNRLRSLLTPVDEQARELDQIFRLAKPGDLQLQSFQENIQKRAESIAKQRKEILLSYIKNNPASMLSFYCLKQYAGPTPDPNIIIPLFDWLSTDIKNSTQGKAYYLYLTHLTVAILGETSPEFTEADTAGKPLGLSSFRGNYLLVSFWASWCEPCRSENIGLVKIYQKYHQKGWEILGVSLDQPNGKNNWLNAIHTDGLTWPQVSDLKFWNSPVVNLYGIKSLPHNVLLDPYGKIIAQDLTNELLTKKLAEIYGF